MKSNEAVYPGKIKTYIYEPPWLQHDIVHNSRKFALSERYREIGEPTLFLHVYFPVSLNSWYQISRQYITS